MISGKILLTRHQVREVDRRAIEDYGIPGIVLMENAGRGAAEVLRRLYVDRAASPENRDRFIAVICGRGNNGGDGLVIARHLANADIPVEVFPASDPALLAGDAVINYHIVHQMGLTQHPFDTPQRITSAMHRLHQAGIVVDAILGTGFSGEVRAPFDRVIGAINQHPPPPDGPMIVAVDLPSGLDCDTGQPSNATVRADVTLTFVARKKGFAAAGAMDYTGRVEVVDIGAPPQIIHSVLASADAG